MKKLLILGFFFFFGIVAYGQTVYSSVAGTKYHTADCKLSGDASPMTLKAAQAAGKTSCNVCKADDHIKDKTKQCSGKTADGTQCKRMTASASGKCYQHTKQ